MSDENFQDRLRRISAKSQQQQPMAGGAGPVARSGAPKPNYRFLGAGGAIMALGIQAVKFTNENYQSIKASSGAYAGLGVGLAGIVVILIGIVVIARAVAKGYAAPAPHHSASVGQAKRKPSKIAQVFFSLLGLAFGAIASLYMFMGAAARFIETERAPAFTNGCVLIAMFLCLLSLFFGFVSLFLRGYALGRVPFYFLIGGVLTFVAVRAFRINMLEWQQLTDFLQ